MKTQVNEIQVSYKERIKAPFWPKIKSSKDAAQLLFEHWDKNTIGLHESFKIMLLNNSNKVKGIYPLSKGGITGTIVDYLILFALILKSLSVAFIISHNHPSGKLQASSADTQITDQIRSAAQLLNIKLLDHILIVPNGEYYSFADNGLI